MGVFVNICLIFSYECAESFVFLKKFENITKKYIIYFRKVFKNLTERRELMNNLKTDDFDFELDESLIAQFLLKDRSSSKLLVVNRENFDLEHKNF